MTIFHFIVIYISFANALNRFLQKYYLSKKLLQMYFTISSFQSKQSGNQQISAVPYVE